MHTVHDRLSGVDAVFGLVLLGARQDNAALLAPKLQPSSHSKPVRSGNQQLEIASSGKACQP